MKYTDFIDPENCIVMSFSTPYVTDVLKTVRVFYSDFRRSVLTSSTITVLQSLPLQSDSHTVTIRMPLDEESLYDLSSSISWRFNSIFKELKNIDIYKSGYLSTISEKDLMLSDEEQSSSHSARCLCIYEHIKKIIKWEENND